jgi:dTDP-4-amino-4,6-dideoxygalactose transaminase
VAARYDAALSGTDLAPPARRPDAEHVFHQYVIRSPDRDAMRARLRAAGIGTGIHYPVPVHEQPAYEGRVALGPAACRASARAAREILSLPMFPELTDAQLDAVCAALRTP